jgi:arsenite-transporting ATPase
VQLDNVLGADGQVVQDLASSIPGIDEAMSFTEVIKLVKSMEFSVVVFDTAPTGHTLRFLSLPTTLEKSLGKFMAMKDRFAGLFQQFSSMFGPEGGDANLLKNFSFDEMKKVITEVNTQFKNSELTTFVCVCIPEFLSLYETERMIQELAKFEIDVQNVVVNQVLYPDKPCSLCQARSKMQKKYLDQIHDLYEDFHVVKMPLLESEIRGVDSLTKFSNFLMTPYRS